MEQFRHLFKSKAPKHLVRQKVFEDPDSHDVDSDHGEDVDDHGHGHDIEEHDDEHLSAEHESNDHSMEHHAHKNSHAKESHNVHNANAYNVHNGHNLGEHGLLDRNIEILDIHVKEHGHKHPKLKRHSTENGHNGQNQEYRNPHSENSTVLHAKEHGLDQKEQVREREVSRKNGPMGVKHVPDVELLENVSLHGANLMNLQVQGHETPKGVHSIEVPNSHTIAEKHRQNNQKKDRHRNIGDNFRPVQPLNGRQVLDVDTSVRHYKNPEAKVRHFIKIDLSEEMDIFKKDRLAELRAGFKLVRVRSVGSKLNASLLLIVALLAVMQILHQNF